MIRNCLGITLEDLKNDLFAHLDIWLLDWLLDQECGGGGAGEAALSNFDSFSAFTAKKALDELNRLDATNGMVSGNDVYGFLKDNMDDYLDEFAVRECTGQNVALDDLVSSYKDDPYRNMYPDTLSDSKKELLLEHLRDTNFDSFIRNGNNPSLGNSIPYIILTDQERGDDMQLPVNNNVFGPSILSQIPVSALENFDMDKMIYTKCFRLIFELENYFAPDDVRSRPVMTDYKLQCIRRVHNEILVPIYRYYYGNEDDGSCRMRIHGGITSMQTAIKGLTASYATRHIYGQCVNFSLTTVSNERVLEDIASGAIGVQWGVLALVNGVYISLPYTYENYEVRGVVLGSPKFDSDDIRVKFA